MHSCLYRGMVTHRRKSPVEHEFSYGMFWLYVDLDEWEQDREKVQGLTDRFFAPASFCRCDHLGEESTKLSTAVKEFVKDEAGEDLAVETVRLLTQPRSFGFYFSPLNLYFCFALDGQLAAVVAEVNNTPWGEQHCYLLWHGNRLADSEFEYRHDKAFHVSPFMEMHQQYAWRVGVPGDTLGVHLAVEQDNKAFFDAGMKLSRQPLTGWTLAGNLARSPVNAIRVLTAIYFEAFRLWIKRCPYYPHPKTKPNRVPAA